MTSIRTLFEFCGYALIVVVIACLFPAIATASTEVSTSKDVHNGDDLHRPAIGLSFTVHIAESEKNRWWMESYNIYLDPDPFSTVTFTEEYDNNGEICAVDAEYSDGTVYFCDSVKICAEAVLNRGNGIHISDVTWKYHDLPHERIPMPDIGFIFRIIEFLKGAKQNSTFIFENADPNETIVLNYLSFYFDTLWHDASTQWGGVGQWLQDVNGPFTMAPGDLFTVDLLDIPHDPGFIYVAGELEYQMPGSVFERRQFRFGHEIENALASNLGSISGSTGGSVVFFPVAGTNYAGRQYAMVGTSSGTSPGFLLPGGGVLPLNPDFVFNYIKSHLNSPMFVDFLSTFDSNGEATAVFNTLGPIPPVLPPGTTLHFAYTTLNPYDFQSNPVGVVIGP